MLLARACARRSGIDPGNCKVGAAARWKEILDAGIEHGFGRVAGQVEHPTPRMSRSDALVRDVDITPSEFDVLSMPTALTAIDPAALRPHSDRSGRVLRTESQIYRPVAFHGDVPEVRVIFLLRSARDPESGGLLVTSYTHAGLAFEADDFADAMRRAVAIVPDFALAAGLGEDGIAIVLDEYPSTDDLGLD